MGELAIICIREQEGQGPAHPLGVYECEIVWRTGGWTWNPVRLLASGKTVTDLILAGHRWWQTKQRNGLQMSYKDCLYWDKLQGADHVP